MIPNPWLILGAIGVWIVSLIAVGAWQRGDGADAVRADWAEEKAAAATESAAAFKAITERYRDLEQSMAEGMAKIGADYANQTQALNATRRERDDLVAGRSRMRVPGGCETRGGAPAAPGAASGGSDGPAGSYLPPAVAGDLADLARDADQVALQLGACQSVIRSYLPKEAP